MGIYVMLTLISFILDMFNFKHPMPFIRRLSSMVSTNLFLNAHVRTSSLFTSIRKVGNTKDEAFERGSECFLRLFVYL